jgi:hypothetical protein
MDVRLEALEGQVLPQDTFVSLRVGEVQKQSRLASTRTFSFKHGQGQTFGRLEVFKRIGRVSVNLESDVQEVRVPCDSDLQELSMRVTVSDAVKRPVVDKRIDEAQRYVAEHKIEAILADTLKEVMHTRPVDPLPFLAEEILKHATCRPSKPSPPPDVPGKSYASQLAESMMGTRDGDPLPAKSVTPEFNGYSQPAKSAMPELVEQRIAREAIPAVRLQDSLGGEPSALPRFPFRPSVGTWYQCMRRAQQTSISVSQSRVVGPCDVDGNPKQSEATLLPADAAKDAFIHKPSVGSWLVRLPAAYYTYDEESDYIEALQEMIEARDAELAWFKAEILRLQRKARDRGMQLPGDFSAVSPSPATPPHNDTKEELEYDAIPWQHLPSVGTWILLPRRQAPPTIVKKVRHRLSTRKLLDRNLTLSDWDNQEIIRNFCVEIQQRDAEIDRLRAILSATQSR